MDIASARVAAGMKTRAVIVMTPMPPTAGYTLENFLNAHSLSLVKNGGTVTNIIWIQTGIGIQFNTEKACAEFVQSVSKS